MKTLREFRKQGKLSQVLMAEMLKTTRSMINMVERGLRDLPPDSAKRLNELIQHAGTAGKMPLEVEIDIAESDNILGFELKDLWTELLFENYSQLAIQQRKLAKMQKRYNTLLAQSKTLWEVTGKLPSIGGATAELNYFGDRHREAQKKIASHGKSAQLPIQVRIDALLAQEKYLKNCIDDGRSISDIIASNNGIGKMK